MTPVDIVSSLVTAFGLGLAIGMLFGVFVSLLRGFVNF